jgi:hypothetical protein
MASQPRAQLRVDDDGVRFLQISGVRRRVWLLVLALACVSIAVFMFIRPAFRARSQERVWASPPTPAARSAGRAGSARLLVHPPPDRPADRPRAPAENTESAPPSESSASDEAALAPDAKPPTEEAPAAAGDLDVSPRRPDGSEHGVPVPLPDNRVVPPEMASPGLPIEMLEVPNSEGAQDPTP